MGTSTGHFCYTMMKLSVAVAVFFLFGLVVAQDYAYLTYWSDSRCRRFVGSRAMTQNDQFVTGASANSCQQELYCLFDPASSDCVSIANSAGVAIRIQTNGGSVTEFVNGEGTVVDSGDCIESSIYDNCWFNYYTENEVERFFEESNVCDNNSSGASALVFSAVAFGAVAALLI